jgi:hypothetical protein
MMLSAQDRIEMRKFIGELHAAIASHIQKTHYIEYGTVKQVSPLLVQADGQVTPKPAAKNASYSPALNDRVLMHVVRNQQVVAFAIG